MSNVTDAFRTSISVSLPQEFGEVVTPSRTVTESHLYGSSRLYSDVRFVTYRELDHQPFHTQREGGFLT